MSLQNSMHFSKNDCMMIRINITPNEVIQERIVCDRQMSQCLPIVSDWVIEASEWSTW